MIMSLKIMSLNAVQELIEKKKLRTLEKWLEESSLQPLMFTRN